MKAKEQQSTSTFLFNIEGTHLFVTLEQVNNNASGNPRFKASVFCQDLGYETTVSGYPYHNYEGKPNHEVKCLIHNTYVYTFDGHFMSHWNEAYYIANYHYDMHIRGNLIDVIIDGEHSCINPSALGETLRDFVVIDNDTIYHIQEGTGDALTQEDIDNGCVDYIYYDVLEDANDLDSIIDGGCILLNELYAQMSIDNIIKTTIAFDNNK